MTLFPGDRRRTRTGYLGAICGNAVAGILSAFVSDLNVPQVLYMAKYRESHVVGKHPPITVASQPLNHNEICLHLSVWTSEREPSPYAFWYEPSSRSMIVGNCTHCSVVVRTAVCHSSSYRLIDHLKTGDAG